jgi:hypothetical protein
MTQVSNQYLPRRSRPHYLSNFIYLSLYKFECALHGLQLAAPLIEADAPMYVPGAGRVTVTHHLLLLVFASRLNITSMRLSPNPYLTLLATDP